jgi:hypothetical protein
MDTTQPDRARTRRRTAGAVATVVGVVAVVGGAAVLSRTHRDDADPPRTSPPGASTSPRSHEDHLAPPGALDAAGLTAATGARAHPWRTTPWPDGRVSEAMARCLGSTSESSDGSAPTEQPSRLGLAAFRADDGGLAVVAASSYRSPAEVADTWTKGLSRLQQCRGARTFSTTWPGGTGMAYRLLPTEGAPQDLWLARVGTGLGFVWVERPGPAPGRAPPSRVLEALASVLRHPAAYPSNPMDPTLGPAPGHAFGSVDADTLALVLRSWHTAWAGPGNPTGNSLPHLPCEDPGRNTLDATGTGAGVGVDGGTWFWELRSEQEARAGLETLTRLLRGCAGYDVSDAAPDTGHPTVVAFSPHRQVVWLTQYEASVGYLILPAGATPPPHDVTVSVAAELRLALSGG